MSNVPAHTERQAVSLFQREIVTRALIDSFKKLDPRIQLRNPVMFVVELGSVITTSRTASISTPDCSSWPGM